MLHSLYSTALNFSPPHARGAFRVNEGDQRDCARRLVDERGHDCGVVVPQRALDHGDQMAAGSIWWRSRSNARSRVRPANIARLRVSSKYEEQKKKKTKPRK